MRELLKGSLSLEKINEQKHFFELNLPDSFAVILFKLIQPKADQLQRLQDYFEHHYAKALIAVIGLDCIVLIKQIAVNPLEN